jgi:hypothetical protein
VKRAATSSDFEINGFLNDIYNNKIYEKSRKVKNKEVGEG